MSLEEAAPPPVPDNRNLAMAPGLETLLDYRRETLDVTREGIPWAEEIQWGDPVESARLSVATVTPHETRSKEPRSTDWTQGKSIPLAEWQAYYRALAVRNWLDQPDSPPYTAGPYSFLDHDFNPRLSFRRLIPELIRCTARVHMARTAIALERCRHSRGTYPETLAELVPEFLASIPPDPIDRQHLRYRRLPDTGGFVLYSIGLDGRDDEALIIDDRRDLFEPQAHGTGDWVWPRRDLP